MELSVAEFIELHKLVRLEPTTKKLEDEAGSPLKAFNERLAKNSISHNALKGIENYLGKNPTVSDYEKVISCMAKTLWKNGIKQFDIDVDDELGCTIIL